MLPTPKVLFLAIFFQKTNLKWQQPPQRKCFKKQNQDFCKIENFQKVTSLAWSPRHRQVSQKKT
jgi:hypothetical protein